MCKYHTCQCMCVLQTAIVLCIGACLYKCVNITYVSVCIVQYVLQTAFVLCADAT